jgi:hypothetical protein
MGGSDEALNHGVCVRRRTRVLGFRDKQLGTLTANNRPASVQHGVTLATLDDKSSCEAVGGTWNSQMSCCHYGNVQQACPLATAKGDPSLKGAGGTTPVSSGHTTTGGGRPNPH